MGLVSHILGQNGCLVEEGKDKIKKERNRRECKSIRCINNKTSTKQMREKRCSYIRCTPVPKTRK